jgi:orotate phosphoribosyltransferase
VSSLRGPAELPSLTGEEVRQIFIEAGALLEGHFLLASGRHSPQFLDKFRIYEHPRLTQRLCEGIVERLDQPIDAVVGPAIGGIFLAHEVARQAGARALYAERDENRPGRALRRGQVLRPGERVLVVDDILSTGGSMRETIDPVIASGARPVMAAVLVNRGGDSYPGIPFTALWTTHIPTYEPEICVLCGRAVPLTKPGANHVPLEPVR